jgi:hypothetical protein
MIPPKFLTHRENLILAILAAVFMVLLTGRGGSACECAGSTYPIRKDIAESVADADLVFTGTVKAIFLRDSMTAPGEISNLVADFSVIEIFKGINRSQFFISTGAGAATSLGSADCGFPFRAGETYLVYAWGDKLSLSYGTSYCSRTAPLAFAEADMRFLKRQPPAPEDLLGKTDFSNFIKRSYRKICGRITWDAGSYSELKTFDLFLWTWKGGRWTWPFWTAGRVSDNGTYCTELVEPGKYKIGGTRGNWDQEWLLGYYGSASRMEEAKVIAVGRDADVHDINFALNPIQSHTISGRVLLSGASEIPSGQIEVNASNDWDGRLDWARKGIVQEDGAFKISGLYPGRVRLSLSFKPAKSGDDGVWRASIPEILVPEEANNVKITLRRETFFDRISRYWEVFYSHLMKRIDTTPK